MKPTCAFTVFFVLAITARVLAQAPLFSWPEGKKAAISLTFDDARLSNVDVGLDLFAKSGTRVTYYVNPGAMEPRLEKWQKAVKAGHEIGNHTVVHPCSENFDWARSKGLETYNLASMRRELLAANDAIQDMLGVTPVSFAYSCGQTYVGRGTQTQSYVPLVAELFSSGRGWLDEAPNDPLYADFAQLMGVESDGKSFEQIKPMVDAAVKNGKWLVLAGHEIGGEAFQTTRVTMLEQVISYVNQPNSGIWLAPVGEISAYVKNARQQIYQNLRDHLTFYASFDEKVDADVARGDQQPYFGQNKGLPEGVIWKKEGGRRGGALHFTRKASPPLYYSGFKNAPYAEGTSQQGTISLWMSLDPELDLEPGYVDPIQVTDVTYNDAALWVDFSDKNPRLFRMGVFGDLQSWNPQNIDPDKNPKFNERLVVAKDRGFGRGIWTHVVIVYKNLNSPQGTAQFYVDGKLQGERIIPEAFTWTWEKAKIFLGLNYIGWMDEVALFDRALTVEEVNILYRMEHKL